VTGGLNKEGKVRRNILTGQPMQKVASDNRIEAPASRTAPGICFRNLPE
jgi:hypothetical protein